MGTAPATREVLLRLRGDPIFAQFLAQLGAEASAATRGALFNGPTQREFNAGYAAALTDLFETITTLKSGE